MRGINNLIDEANQRAEQEREASILKVRTALQAEGKPECVDCAELIDAERRAAMPSACRCITCQTLFERDYARWM